MNNVSIAGSGDSISIEVLGYENTFASDESDANWLRSRIRIKAGPFSGETSAALTTQDFSYFERELAEALHTLKGKVAFQTDEDNLRFDIEFRSRGMATVSGFVKTMSAGESQASLRFAFETDQSYLAQTQSALTQIVKNFPEQKRNKQ